jgi:hypothetical protein
VAKKGWAVAEDHGEQAVELVIEGTPGAAVKIRIDAEEDRRQRQGSGKVVPPA